MDLCINQSPRGGTLRAVTSKSAAHRLLICAALAGRCLLDLGVRGKIMCGKNPKRRAGSVMAFFWNLIRSLMRMAVGIVVLFCAAAIPAYFVSTDSKTLSAAASMLAVAPLSEARWRTGVSKSSKAEILIENTDLGVG